MVKLKKNQLDAIVLELVLEILGIFLDSKYFLQRNKIKSVKHRDKLVTFFFFYLVEKSYKYGKLRFLPSLAEFINMMLAGWCELSGCGHNYTINI